MNELRKARQFTQAGLAATLGVDQGSISKMEQRTDMYISTLRSYIEAMAAIFASRPRFPRAKSASINSILCDCYLTGICSRTAVYWFTIRPLPA